MTRRFWQASQDSRILKSASMLKLCLYRDEEGELSGSFTLEGWLFTDFGDNAERLEAMPGRVGELVDLIDKFREHPELAGRPEFEYALGFLLGIADNLGCRGYWKGSADAGVFFLQAPEEHDA